MRICGPCKKINLAGEVACNQGCGEFSVANVERTKEAERECLKPGE